MTPMILFLLRRVDLSAREPFSAPPREIFLLMLCEERSGAPEISSLPDPRSFSAPPRELLLQSNGRHAHTPSMRPSIPATALLGVFGLASCRPATQPVPSPSTSAVAN